MVAKNFFVWIEPMQGCLMVSAETYQKLFDLKMWASPEELVVLSKKRRALRVREFDVFVSMSRRITHLLRRLDHYWDQIRLNSDVFDDEVREVLLAIETLMVAGYFYLLQLD